MPRANGTSPRHVPVISSAISSGVSLHSEDPVSAALVKRFAAGDVCDSGGSPPAETTSTTISHLLIFVTSSAMIFFSAK
ncbi:hypothetical protein PC128_g18884 [Phytophthora cactorum]|nr:hypothetical protein PC122_g14520 [Phytophthora cactorum]KAG3170746.1 hypothetical protein PC128_g18884 [Phytophthora cactorum]